MSTERIIDYWYADPTGNITLLVESPCCPEDYPALAETLLKMEPDAEQVGFLEPDAEGGMSLHMAGGEFCGNASLSTGAAMAEKTGLTEADFLLKVFGTPAFLQVSVRRAGSNRYEGTVEMPRPEHCAPVSLIWEGTVFELPLVTFPGISHLLCEHPLQQDMAEAAIREWSAVLDVPALGIMQLDRKRNSLLPLVYVPAIDTLYWERSCASGTCAAAFHLAQKQHAGGFWQFSEPGGVLGARVSDGTVWLSGSVALEKRSIRL